MEFTWALQGVVCVQKLSEQQNLNSNLQSLRIMWLSSFFLPFLNMVILELRSSGTDPSRWSLFSRQHTILLVKAHRNFFSLLQGQILFTNIHKGVRKDVSGK